MEPSALKKALICQISIFLLHFFSLSGFHFYAAGHFIIILADARISV